MQPSRIVTLIALAAVAAIAGCNSISEQRQWQLSSTSYQTATAAVTNASAFDLISLEDLERFAIVEGQAYQLLDEWRMAIIAGEPFGAKQALSRLLDTLILYQMQSQKSRTNGGDNNSGSSDSGQDGRGGGLEAHRRDLGGSTERSDGTERQTDRTDRQGHRSGARGVPRGTAQAA